MELMVAMASLETVPRFRRSVAECAFLSLFFNGSSSFYEVEMVRYNINTS